MSVKLLDSYVADVLAGRIVTGLPVRWACERHVRDMDRQLTEAFPYHFDPSAAEHFFDFSGHVQHFEGEWAGRPFSVEPWQAFILGSVFGWLRVSDGLRRFRKVWTEVARKQGKTFVLAICGHYLLDMDDEPGAQIFTGATKRSQAGIMFRAAVRMRDHNASLKHRVGKYGIGASDEIDSRARLFVEETESFWKPLGADSETEDGLNPHGILIDEVHAHRDGGLVNVLESAIGARRQPLTFFITTAGTDIYGYGHEMHEAHRRIVDPESGIEAEDTFVYIAELDEGDDWKDPAAWIKANPNLDVSVRAEYIAGRVAQAQTMPHIEVDVRTKNLNQWVSSSERWLPAESWDACAGDWPEDCSIPERVLELEERLAGRRCFGGLDLSSNRDLTAFVLAFPWEDGEGFDVIPWLWIPELNIEERERYDRVPYRQWAAAGLISTTPGNVIDYEWIRSDILEAMAIYQIEEIAFDPWRSTETAVRLQEFGLRMVQCRQGFATMSEPTKRLETLVLSQQVRHGGHPVLRWMAENVQLVHDPVGNVKPSKGDAKQRRRIDGVVALIMALWSASRSEGIAVSVYESDELPPSAHSRSIYEAWEEPTA